MDKAVGERKQGVTKTKAERMINLTQSPYHFYFVKIHTGIILCYTLTNLV
jgi:hypothetical protein